MPNLYLGDVAPDFTFKSTQHPDDTQWHDYIDASWTVLFSHPKDYTPVCTTELGRVVQMKDTFQSRGVKVAAYSCDTLEDHHGWSENIKSYCGCDAVWFPIIDGNDRKVAELYGMLGEGLMDDKTKMPLTVRSVFIISPSKVIKCILTYPASTGRNFDEIIRIIDSFQLASKTGLCTPQGWTPGSTCVVPPNMTTDDAKAKFPEGFKQHFDYLRTVDDPSKN